MEPCEKDTVKETVVEKTDTIVEETIEPIEEASPTYVEPVAKDSSLPEEVSEEDSLKR